MADEQFSFTGKLHIDTDSAIQEAKALSSQIKSAIDKVDMTKVDHGTLQLIHSIERMLMSLEKVVKTTEELGSKKLPTAEYRKLTTEATMLDRKAETLKKTLDGLNESGYSGTSTYQKTEKELAAVLEKQYAVSEEMRKMRDAKADYTSGKDTQAYKDSAAAINQMSQAVAVLCRNMGELNAASMQESADSERVAEGMQHVNETMEENSRTLGSYIGAVRNRLAPVIQRLGNLIARLWRGFRSLVSHIRSATHHNERFGRSLGASFRNILNYTLGVSSLLALINRTRGYIAEAFKVMAQEIPEVNQSISMLGTSFKQLKAAFGTMLQPLLQALAPIINSIIQRVLDLMNALARFFATLTGQNYIYEATVANYDYAESVKEAEGALASFDKLNVINKEKNSGLQLDKRGVKYNKVEFNPEEKWYTKLANSIKKAIKKADFTDVTNSLAKKIAAALNGIEWKDIRSKTTKFTKMLATGINGITLPNEGTGRSELADAIGNFLAQALQTAIDNFDTFVTTVDWKNLGKFIADATETLKTTLRNNESWKAAGDAFGHLFQGLVDFGLELIVKGNIFSGLGNDLYTMLSSALEKGLEVNKETGNTYLRDFGIMITDAITKFLDEVIAFLDATEKDGKLGEAINQLFLGIDVLEIAKKLVITFLKGFKLGLKLLVQAGLGALGISADDGTVEFLAEALGIGLLGKKIAQLVTGITGSGGLLSAFGKKDNALKNQTKKLGLDTVASAVLGTALGWMGGKALTSAGNIDVLTGSVVELQPAIDNIAVPSLERLSKGIDNVADAGKNACTELRDDVFQKNAEIVLNTALTISTNEAAWRNAQFIAADVDMSSFAATIPVVQQTLSTIEQMCANGNFAVHVKTIYDTDRPPVTTPSTEPQTSPYGHTPTSQEQTRINQEGLAKADKNYGHTPTSSEQAAINQRGLADINVSDNAKILDETLLNYWGDDQAVFMTSFYKNAETYGYKPGDDISKVLADNETFSKVLQYAISNTDWTIERRTNTNMSLGEYLEDLFGLNKNPLPSVKSGLSNLLKWLPLAGSATSGFPIPFLAQGAVLPPNNPFLAVLGDQKSGTNVETPLSTIEQAVANVLSRMQIKNVFDVQGDPYRLFKVVQKQATIEYNQSGETVAW